MTTLKNLLNEKSFKTALTDKKVIKLDDAIDEVLSWLYEKSKYTTVKELAEELENES
jgi:hypothetical protein